MNLLLAFAPFLAFAVLDRLLGTVPALCAAAAMAALTSLRGWLVTRSLMLLEVGSALLFGGLASYAVVTGAGWPTLKVRLLVDAGLLLVVLASLLVRRPFTLQYARQQAPLEVWALPAFRRLNDVLTAAWALSFAVMVLVDAVMLYAPSVPLWLGVAATAAALVAALRFTAWYPSRVRSRGLAKAAR